MGTNVALVRCETYDIASVKHSLRQSVKHLGGFEPFLTKGERVMLKINLLMRKKPEYAVTTHPTFVQALAELLIEYGCKVVIGDSPSGPFSVRLLKGQYNTTGMEDVARQTGAMLNFNVDLCERDNPEGVILKKLTLTDMINDVDKIISVSKLKTHGMMTFTGAVKNMFGLVPGTFKYEYHLNMCDYGDFANALVDICSCCEPVLSFMDGVDAMEGNGPSAGSVRHVGAILASSSPYHLDKVACSLMGLDFSHAPTVVKSIERGLCAKGLEDVTLCGSPITSFTGHPFKTADTSILFNLDKIPRVAHKIINKLLQPKLAIDYERCVKCGICADNCPAKTISMDESKPVIDMSNCIRCYCCQETCPQHCVTTIRPPLLRLFTGH